jgi:hypothetical protein
MEILKTLEYLGGERDDAPEGLPPFLQSLAVRCVLWIACLLLIYGFCGQASKFVYIDF